MLTRIQRRRYIKYIIEEQKEIPLCEVCEESDAELEQRFPTQRKDGKGIEFFDVIFCKNCAEKVVDFLPRHSFEKRQLVKKIIEAKKLSRECKH